MQYHATKNHKKSELQHLEIATKAWDQFWAVTHGHYGGRNSPLRSKTVTSEQEAQLERLETELAIADKQLRLIQVKKQIAETELDILGLHQTLQLQAEGTPVRQF